MTSSIPPVSHLSQHEALAVMRQREAMSRHPLSLDALLSGCSRYEERVDFDIDPDADTLPATESPDAR